VFILIVFFPGGSGAGRRKPGAALGKDRKISADAELFFSKKAVALVLAKTILWIFEVRLELRVEAGVEKKRLPRLDIGAGCYRSAFLLLGIEGVTRNIAQGGGCDRNKNEEERQASGAASFRRHAKLPRRFLRHSCVDSRRRSARPSRPAACVR